LQAWFAGTLWGYYLFRAVTVTRAAQALPVGYPIASPCLAARAAAGTPLPQVSVVLPQRAQHDEEQDAADEERCAMIKYTIEGMAPDLFTELLCLLHPKTYMAPDGVVRGDAP
jgi:hypothetical protein